MSTCHVVSSATALSHCVTFVRSGDVVVFEGAGVLCVDQPDRLPDVPCYFISDDVAARGMVVDAQVGFLLTIDAFVNLLLEHDNQVSWP